MMISVAISVSLLCSINNADTVVQNKRDTLLAGRNIVYRTTVYFDINDTSDSWKKYIHDGDAGDLNYAAHLEFANPNQKTLQIEASRNYETNEQQLDELLTFIEQEGPEAVDSAAWAWVGWLANSCPLAEGYCVYTARALYQYIDHTLDYDDVPLCEQAGYFKTDETGGKVANFEGEKAKLWYDKKAQSALISYDFLPGAKGEVAVYDVMGKIITKTTLEANQKLAIIDLKNIALGEYLYTIKSNEGFIHNGKFIAIK